MKLITQYNPANSARKIRSAKTMFQRIQKMILQTFILLTMFQLQTSFVLAWQQSTADVPRLVKQALQLDKEAKHQQAIDKWKRVLAIQENKLGPNHSYVASSLNNIALLYQKQQKNRKAELLMRRSLKIDEKELKPDDLSLGTSFHNLAGICKDLEKYPEAESLYKRALSIREQKLGANHLEVSTSLNNLANTYTNQGKYTEAERLYKRSLKIKEQKLRADHPVIAVNLNNLARTYFYQKRYKEAEPLFQRALAIYKKQPGKQDPNVKSIMNNLVFIHNNSVKHTKARTVSNLIPLKVVELDKEAKKFEKAAKYERAVEIRKQILTILNNQVRAEHPEIATSLNNLAHLYLTQGKIKEAVPLFQRALKLNEKIRGSEQLEVAINLNNLAQCYSSLSQYSKAIEFYKRSLKIFEKRHGDKNLDVIITLTNMGHTYYQLADYHAAEKVFKRALNIAETVLDADDPQVAISLNGLAGIYLAQGKYSEAEPLFQKSQRILEKKLVANHPYVANSLNSLGYLYTLQGKYSEAEALIQRAHKMYEKTLDADHPTIALSCNNLARLYLAQGRYSEAVSLYQRALGIQEKKLGPETQNFASTLNNLAGLYKNQGNYSAAEPLYQRAQKIKEKILKLDHREIAVGLNNLAEMYRGQKRYSEAEILFQRALEIYQKNMEADHPYIAGTLNNLAYLHYDQGEYVKAEQLFQQALKIYKKRFVEDHPSISYVLNSLAKLNFKLKKYTEAEVLVDQALRIMNVKGVGAGTRSSSYLLRAKIAWKQKRRGEAIADLREAMRLAEQQRTQLSGGAGSRAKSFASYTSTFETMVVWQEELKDLANMTEVLSAIERRKARSLLDDIQQSGTNLNIGRSLLERQQLADQERRLKEELTILEKELTKENRAEIEPKIIDAKKALVEHYNKQRTSSPIYQNLLTVGSGPPRLRQLQRDLVKDDNLLLIYMIGEDGSYLLSIAPDQSRVFKLEIDEKAANLLNSDAGPLTSKRLSSILTNKQKTGVLQILSNSRKSNQSIPQLAELWKILIPEELRQSLTDDSVKRLMIIPDGPLALLPFEALVVEYDQDDPTYLIDHGPPIQYAPSATVLYNLSQRSEDRIQQQAKPVLTVGDPAYPQKKDDPANSQKKTDTPPSALELVSSRSRYSLVGGSLPLLPFTSQESIWIRDVFNEAGVKTTQLLKSNATELNIRNEVVGRKLLHFACHGLTDHAYGNFFGALAVTPGSSSENDSNNDGFLMLSEIYQLNLKGCELAILSACETNYGPQQKGEGVWSLSRGFLVAGTKRVVASNWLVDDKAGASLISYFCSIIAKAEKKGQKPDYALALHKAKKWVRDQEKWSSPYYWGTFVLVGPN
jgi:tetratricopeptide (TPR) repeat protein